MAGIFRARLADVYALWHAKRDVIEVGGFVEQASGVRNAQSRQVSRHDFVPHSTTYFHQVLHQLLLVEQQER
ncbi:hypothetical protein [Salsuginibacillus kocurii]|uniref:hypothetical protein n=1 Tax=Salsuginibacillus kocurii TaxID=427078 RepID=UPI00036EF720|nr:hypothetical protein [Salsuginibacillus kocurii]